MFCGPFDILEPVATGGMGAVFRARHRRDATLAAVKVIREWSDDEAEHRRFVREVQWLARLDHRSIARVYDFGIADRETVDTNFLQPGAPWLAMEFVRGTSSKRQFEHWDWRALRTFLQQTLEALAHAHARGVVHRDLKPANVLVDGDDDSLRVKLVDFGIATTLGAVEKTVRRRNNVVRGTPDFMAPEQILDRASWFGPWTDVYALGCLAWYAACGRPPFRRETTNDTLVAQVHDDIGTFDPQYDVPSGLVDWLRRALAKHPRHRFRRAADAMHALESLDCATTLVGTGSIGGEVSEPWEETPTVSVGSEPTHLLSDADLDPSAPTVRESTPAIGRLRRDENLLGDRVDTADRGIEVPPFPSDWRAGGEELVPLPPSEAGLELFALREFPMVGRFDERDALWRALGEVCERGSLSTVVMRGEPGCGKSRLARWLVERAHEVGVAIPMEATHARVPDASHGLGPMLAEYLRVRGEPWSRARPMMVERLEQLGIDEQRCVAYAYGFGGMFGMEPSQAAERGALGFQSGQERNRAMHDVLSAIARERPLILLLDDAHWGDESLEFVEYLTEYDDGSLACLVLVAVRDSELLERSYESQALDRLLRREQVSEFEIEPLTRANIEAMVESMLSFHPDVVGQVVERAEGHPLFATQIIDHWVERGALQLHEGSFRLDPDADVELPETLESIWKRRIDHVLARLTASAEERAHLTELLQVAAALGQHVNTRELREAALEAGIWEPNQLQDGLIDAGLARPTPDGWRFDHRLLWEAISTWASKDGNWTRWLSACASALADRAEHDRSGRTAWRMAQYLLEAGEREAALEPLQLAVRRFRHIGHERWGDVVTRRAEVIDELGLGVDDRRVVQSLIEQAMKAERDNRLDDTASIRDRAEQSARTNGFDVELARVLQDRATLARREGEIQKALDYLDEARELLDPEKHPEAHARATGNTATTLIQCARPGEARVLLEDVLEAARHNGLVTVELRSLVTIGWTWMEQGEAERAAEYGHLAYDKSTDYGHRTAEGSACVLLSDAYRELEDFACSREWSERALALFQSRGVETSAAVVELNLLMTDLMSGDFERARQSLPRLRDKVEQIGSSARQRFILACEMVLAAEAGEREAFAHALDALEGQLASSSTLMRDIPVMVELAADMARGTDFGKPAEDAVELVERLWREYSGDADATSVDSTREDG